MKIGQGKARLVWYGLLGLILGGFIVGADSVLERVTSGYGHWLILFFIPLVSLVLIMLGRYENRLYEWGSQMDDARRRTNDLIAEAISCQEWSPAFEEEQLATCWKQLDCDKEDCPAYGREHARCWLVAGTFCRGAVQGQFANKLKDCRLCEIYRQAASDPVSEITENFHAMRYLLSEREEELARAYEEARSRGEKLAGLVGLSESALSSLHLTELLQNLLESSASFIGADFGFISLVDAGHRELTARVTYGLEPGAAHRLVTGVGEGVMGKAFDGRYIAVSEDVTGDANVHDYLRSLKTRTMICLPLVGREQPLGLLTLGTLSPHRYSEEEKDSLHVAAGRIAAAIESSQLVSKLDRDRGQIELMSAVVSESGFADSVGGVYRSFIRQAEKLVGFDRASLILWDRETDELEIAASQTRAHKSWLNEGLRFPLSAMPASVVIKSGQPLIRDEIFGDEFPVDKLLIEEGIRSFLMLPLFSRGEVMGVVAFGSCQHAAYSQHDVKILQPVIGQLGLILDNIRLSREARRNSYIDNLTGLSNHRYFFEVLGREVARSSRYERSLSLIMIDIDEFRKFNEALGRREGDRILKAVADSLRASVREIDLVARSGGDEFAVLLPEVRIANSEPGGADAMRLADRIRQAVIACAPDGGKGPAGELAVSIGIAEFPTHGEDVSTLLEHVSKAMESAKAAGHNQIVIAA